MEPQILIGAVSMRDVFADVQEANARYAENYTGSDLTGVAREGLAIVTCMDSRIAPLSVVGLQPGDVKIIRNAGARVTHDVLRTLVLATHLLGVTRVLVMPHTDCKMASGDEWSVHEQIRLATGTDTRSLEIQTVGDQRAALAIDVMRIRSFPLLPSSLHVAGAILDLHTGSLEWVKSD